jgi:hypothetical protein
MHAKAFENRSLKGFIMQRFSATKRYMKNLGNGNEFNQ